MVIRKTPSTAKGGAVAINVALISLLNQAWACKHSNNFTALAAWVLYNRLLMNSFNTVWESLGVIVKSFKRTTKSLFQGVWFTHLKRLRRHFIVVCGLNKANSWGRFPSKSSTITKSSRLTFDSSKTIVRRNNLVSRDTVSLAISLVEEMIATIKRTVPANQAMK